MFDPESLSDEELKELAAILKDAALVGAAVAPAIQLLIHQRLEKAGLLEKFRPLSKQFLAGMAALSYSVNAELIAKAVGIDLERLKALVQIEVREKEKESVSVQPPWLPDDVLERMFNQGEAN